MRQVTSEGPCALIGQVVDGKYEVIRLVGEGAMGAVYEARHLIIGRRVALKILHAQLAAYPEMMERFLQEARVAGSLGHGNICEVTDLGMTEEGQPFLVLPFLEGSSLRDELNRHAGRLATDRVFDILCQVMVALQRAHEMSVVHRDLKPENIFLTQMGERTDFVKVLDFGISKVLARDATDTPGLTHTGAVLGTPFYMSPEQARGVRDVDYRVDVYAVAVLAFEMLTGRRPFEGANYNEVIYRIGTEPFPDAHAVDPSVPVAVAGVIRRGGAKASADRWRSLREFRRALVSAALEGGMRLPAYLSQPDVTGEIALLGAADLAPRETVAAPRPDRGAETVVGRSVAGAQDPVAPVGAHDRTVLGHPLREPAPPPGSPSPTPAPAPSDSWVDRPIQLEELAPPPVPAPGSVKAGRSAPLGAASPAGAAPLVLELGDVRRPINPGGGQLPPAGQPVARAAVDGPRRRGPGLGRILAVAAAVLVLAAGGAWWLHRSGPTATRAPAPSTPAPDPGVDRAPPLTGHVRIYFRVDPPESVLTHAGRTTREKLLTLPRSSRGVLVRFHARGYQPQELTVVPDQDRTVLVSLIRR